jgi:hypothetical protein
MDYLSHDPEMLCLQVNADRCRKRCGSTCYGWQRTRRRPRHLASFRVMLGWLAMFAYRMYLRLLAMMITLCYATSVGESTRPNKGQIDCAGHLPRSRVASPASALPGSPALPRHRHRHRHLHHRTVSPNPLNPLLFSIWLNPSFLSLLIDSQSLDPTPPAHEHHILPPLAAFPWASSLPKSQERVGKTRKKMSASAKVIQFKRVQTTRLRRTCLVPLVMVSHRPSAHLLSAYPRPVIRRAHQTAAASARRGLPRVLPGPSRRTALPQTSPQHRPTRPTRPRPHRLSPPSPLLSTSPLRPSSRTMGPSSPPAAPHREAGRRLRPRPRVVCP